ncbi:MAG: 50S ribosomal protein L15 [Gammaproteobacteria bacterium]|nr:50S ribosomal protein L15 [Gammaproteobacteria bacterium]
MRLNDLKPAEGSKKAPRRLGRGIGSGLGKTGGRGHKGQHSRTGHFKIGFEGGQMPMQRRLPKVGFTTQKSLVSAELPLSALNKVEGQEVTLDSLKAAGLIRRDVLHVKVVLSGAIGKAVVLKGIKATKGAVEAITAAGGRVE